MYGAGVKSRLQCKDTTLGTRLGAVRYFSILLLYIIEFTIGNEGEWKVETKRKIGRLSKNRNCDDRNRGMNRKKLAHNLMCSLHKREVEIDFMRNKGNINIV